MRILNTTILSFFVLLALTSTVNAQDDFNMFNTFWGIKEEVKEDKRPDIIVYLSPFENPNSPMARFRPESVKTSEGKILRPGEWALSMQMAKSSNFNPRFAKRFKRNDEFFVNEDQQQNVNVNSYSMKVQRGMKVLDVPFEIGGKLTAYQDVKSNFASDLTTGFHQRYEMESVNPKANHEYGALVGDARKSIAGKDGEIYYVKTEVYVKAQLMAEDLNGLKPNLSIQFTVKPPMGGEDYQKKPGAVATLAMSRQLTNYLSFVGSYEMVYHPLSASDFDTNSDDLKVEDVYQNLYAGIIVDPGKKGGFYFSVGASYLSSNIEYKQSQIMDSHLTSNTDSLTFVAQANYVMKNGWELSAGAREAKWWAGESSNIEHNWAAHEDDITFWFKVSKRF